MEFIPAIEPRYSEPRHLAPVVRVFERIDAGEEVFATVSAPPRIWKTELILIAIAWLLKRNPRRRIGLVGYAQDFIERKSWRAREYARRARVPLHPDLQTKAYWRTGVGEGGVIATSTQGQIVGEGVDVLIGDDLVKDRVSAESSLSRERLHEAWTDVFLTRLEPNGSAIECGHRWHVEDEIGKLVADGWEEIRLAALDSEGRALCPQRFSAAQYAAIRERIGEYAWASLYMQSPRPRGGALFADVHTYETLPAAYRVVIGIDLAYVAKTRADYSVAVVCFVDHEGRFYVVDVIRRQCAAPDFAATLTVLHTKYPTATFASYVSGVERGSLDFMARNGVAVTALHAREDKFARSQLTAASWNVGRILVPQKARWLDAFIEEIVAFTGVTDRNDDQIDALVSAHDAKAGTVAGLEDDRSAPRQRSTRRRVRNGDPNRRQRDGARRLRRARAARSLTEVPDQCPMSPRSRKSSAAPWSRASTK